MATAIANRDPTAQVKDQSDLEGTMGTVNTRSCSIRMGAEILLISVRLYGCRTY